MVMVLSDCRPGAPRSAPAGCAWRSHAESERVKRVRRSSSKTGVKTDHPCAGGPRTRDSIYHTADTFVGIPAARFVRVFARACPSQAVGAGKAGRTACRDDRDTPLSAGAERREQYDWFLLLKKQNIFMRSLDTNSRKESDLPRRANHSRRSLPGLPCLQNDQSKVLAGFATRCARPVDLTGAP